MNNMTAEQFLISKSESKNKDIVLSAMNNGDYTIEMMEEFAKFKVEESKPKSLSIVENEKYLIKSALEKYNGNRKSASEELGMSQRNLYRKLKQIC